MNPPDHRPDAPWEAELDRQLKRLPDRRAPATLASRVLAAIEVGARLPWYRRTWWQWPPAIQGLSLLVASVLLGGLTWLGLHTGRVDLAATLVARSIACLAPLAPLWTALNTLAQAALLLVKQPTLLSWTLLAAFIGALYLSCVGFGTVLYRVILPRRNS